MKEKLTQSRQHPKSVKKKKKKSQSVTKKIKSNPVLATGAKPSKTVMPILAPEVNPKSLQEMGDANNLLLLSKAVGQSMSMFPLPPTTSLTLPTAKIKPTAELKIKSNTVADKKQETIQKFFFEFRHDLLLYTVALAGIAEAFREIEEVFLPYKHFKLLKGVCTNFLKGNYVVFSNDMTKLPKKIEQIRYDFTNEEVLYQKKQTIELNKEVIQSALEKLHEKNKQYVKRYPELLKLFWQRQEDHYSQLIQPILLESKNNKTYPSQIATLKSQLSVCLKQYEVLMRGSSDEIATLICQKLSEKPKPLTRLALELVLIMWTGYDVAPAKWGFTQTPLEVSAFISQLASLFKQIFLEFHYPTNPTPVINSQFFSMTKMQPVPMVKVTVSEVEEDLILRLRSKASPGSVSSSTSTASSLMLSSIFKPSPPSYEKWVIMHLTQSEVELITQLRQKQMLDFQQAF